MVLGLLFALWCVLVILALAMLRASSRADRTSEEQLRRSGAPSAPDRAEGLQRARTAVMLMVAVPLAAAALDAGASTASAAACGGGPARATLCLINVERKQRGLATVRANAKLTRAAHRHSLDMVLRGYFAHQSLSGRTLVDRLRIIGYLGGGCSSWAAGETIAWGSGGAKSPASRVAAWMRSRTHRPIVLGASFREVGIGVAPGTPTGSRAGATYTADFGRRRC
jgi:uncharacterized protein YkwD